MSVRKEKRWVGGEEKRGAWGASQDIHQHYVPWLRTHHPSNPLRIEIKTEIRWFASAMLD